MDTLMTGEYTSTCTCGEYGEDGEFMPDDTCNGWCWDDQMEDFTLITEHLRTLSTEWSITGFPVWNGTRSGEFTARTATELLHSITPDRADWRMVVTVTPTEMSVLLSHHDGSGRMTVTPIVEA